jgi:hypothetical protein
MTPKQIAVLVEVRDFLHYLELCSIKPDMVNNSFDVTALLSKVEQLIPPAVAEDAYLYWDSAE